MHTSSISYPLTPSSSNRLPGLWLTRPPVMLAVSAVAVLALLLMYVRIVLMSPFRDFEAYYSASVLVRDGGNLYERGLRWRDTGQTYVLIPQEMLTEPPPYSHEDPRLWPAYQYPPFAAVALLPLTVLPLREASIIWFTFIVGCLLLTSYLLCGLLFRAHGVSRVGAALILGAALALFQPIRVALLVGQMDLVTLLLLTLALTAFCSGRVGQAGAWLGVAAAIKPFLGFIILFLLWKRAYCGVIVAGGVGLLSIIASLLALGVGPHLDWILVGQYFATSIPAASPNNQSPYGLLLRAFTVNDYTVPIVEMPVLVPVLRYAIAAAAVIVLVRTVSRTRNAPATRLALEYGLTIIAMLMVSPLSEDIHFTYVLILIVALGASIISLARGGSRARGFAAALLGIYAYLSLPMLNGIMFAFYAFHEAPVPLPMSLLTGVHFYGLVALTALTLVVFCRLRKVDALQEGGAPGRAL